MSYIRFFLKAERNFQGVPVVRAYYEAAQRGCEKPIGLVDDQIRKQYPDEYAEFGRQVEASAGAMLKQAALELEQAEASSSLQASDEGKKEEDPPKDPGVVAPSGEPSDTPAE